MSEDHDEQVKAMAEDADAYWEPILEAHWNRLPPEARAGIARMFDDFEKARKADLNRILF